MPGVRAVYTGADLESTVGRTDAVRLGRHRGHAEPDALPDRRRRGRTTR